MESRDYWLEAGGDRIHIHGRRAGDEGIALIDVPMEDLYMPPSEQLTSAGAWQVGSTARKIVEDQRVVRPVLGTHGATIRQHGRVESRLWRVVRRGHPVWWCIRSGSEVRRLGLLLSSVSSSSATPLTPEAYGNNYLEHTLQMIACNPAWQTGSRWSEPWTGPGTGELVLRNRGDRPMWPRYVCTAGSWAIEDGDTGRMVPLPAMGQGFKVWTDPTEPTIEVEAGDSGWPLNMQGVTFTQPIMPGETVTVTVASASGGEIVAELVDQYDRPWG